MPKGDARPTKKKGKAAAYSQIIGKIFERHYTPGASSLSFTRDEIRSTARKLRLSIPKNLGDVLYSFRYRARLPEEILRTCAPGREWIIRSAGPAAYSFQQVPLMRVEPQRGRYQIKVPDATPEIVEQNSLSDEQALLAKLRYNRLVDTFTGLTTYSLQNHLRTQVDGVQIEIDELYVGVGKSGQQYILPVQAKAGRDRIGRVQLEQDVAFCSRRFQELTCRPIAAQFMDNGAIALFELTLTADRVSIVDERHYRLVAASEITPEDLRVMKREPA